MKQYQSETINELAAALAKAQGEMNHAGKSADNPYFKSKYADLPAVIDASRPALAKNGLSVVQMTDIDELGNMVLVTQLSHSSGQWVRSWYPVRPVKSDPQGFGSALTYSRRYAYSALAGVAAVGEDDDGNAASGNVDSPKKKETAKSKSDRFKVLKAAIMGDDDPGAVWHDHMDEINAFLEEDKTFYDDLVQAGKTRRKELEEIANAKASGLTPRD